VDQAEYVKALETELATTRPDKTERVAQIKAEIARVKRSGGAKSTATTSATETATTPRKGSRT